MATLTSKELAAMRARCEAATPGPWFELIDEIAEKVYNERIVIAVGFADPNESAPVPLLTVWDDRSDDTEETDLLFVAHARTDLPRALDEIARLRAALEALLQANTPEAIDAAFVQARAALDEHTADA